jgi:hypothetical protein
VIIALASATLATPVWGRPNSNDSRLRPQFGDLSNPGYGILSPASGVFSTAQAQDTVYFGGTFWNADSSRWEALRDSVWTFDTGVGSNFDHSNPDLDPFKDTRLHAMMEGWIGVDLSYTPRQYFRRLDTSLFGTGQDKCPINGLYSFYAGVLAGEGDSLCYVDGQGYGNNWNICLQQTFAYSGAGSVTLEYEYNNQTELDFDYTYVYVDTSGNDDLAEVIAYSGSVYGTEVLTLVPGTSLPSQAGPITVKFCVVTDGAWSDEDGLYTTKCGAFTVDDISLSGGGISHFTDFETGADGWTVTEPLPGLGGDWSNIVHLSDLPPPLANCVCSLRDSVLVFEDLNGTMSHNLYTNNIAASPWIDLNAAGLVGAPGKFIETDMYADLPFLNYIYAQFFVQWYPYTCPSSGLTITSPWVVDGITHYFGLPQCTLEGGIPFRSDFSALMDPGAEQVRIGIGVFSACLFHTNCTGLTNTSPWFDNVRFGVCGDFGITPTTPVLSVREIDLPQDAFPEDGTLTITSPGRIDAGTVTGGLEPGPFTSLGDTLVVLGGNGGAEVWVQFSVRPGPGVNPTSLSAFLSTVAFQETKQGRDWYAARMDTAEQGGVPSPGTWMTAFHENDPGFAGTDTDIDSGDLDPLGRTQRLANDIFPDDLFTAGTRVDLFYKTKFTASSEWAILPDTAGGRYFEMEVLPSSFDSASTFNCVLYVDHQNRGPGQELIETALSTVIPGGSPNAENTAWDRYDVQAPSSHQATFGRPSDTEYGATVAQVLAYKTILWDSGNIDAVNLVNEDAQVLTNWLLLMNPGSNRLYLSGDGIAASMTAESATDPASFNLLQNLLGVEWQCGTFRDAGCPSGSPLDSTTCVDIDPAGTAVLSLRPHGGTPQGQGNGCPLNRSFDVLSPYPSAMYGVARGEEEYRTSGKTAPYASISNVSTGRIQFKSVVDGLSVHHRREPGVCPSQTLSAASVEERLEEVLSWFGYTGSLPACSDPGVPTAVGDDPPTTFRTALAAFSPNPLMAGTSRGRIEFTLAEDGPVKVAIHDLQGRLVRTVHDGAAARGNNTVFWDGTDGSGRKVASGIYFYTLKTRDRELAKKLVVVR